MNNEFSQASNEANENFSFEDVEKAKLLEKLQEKHYEYVMLDTKPGAQNPSFDIGVEITNDKLVAGKQNIDPQHTHFDQLPNPNTSAIEESMKMELPANGTKFALTRPDMDAVGCIAVNELRNAGVEIDEKLVNAIGRVDALGHRAIEVDPNIENYKKLTLAANQFCLEGKGTIEEKVQFMKELLSGNYNEEQVEILAKQSEKGYEKIKNESVVTVIGPNTVMVESKHPKAFDLGYKQAGIVIAYNPEFTRPWVKNDSICKKWSVGRYSSKEPLDVEGLKNALNKLEQENKGTGSWGGPEGLVGSPVGMTSNIPHEEIIETVKRFIKE